MGTVLTCGSRKEEKYLPKVQIIKNLNNLIIIAYLQLFHLKTERFWNNYSETK